MKNIVTLGLCFTLTGYSIHPIPPLLKKYPTIQSKLYHISLGNYPTPIVNAEALAHQLGVKKLYIKDDGVNGFTILRTESPLDSFSCGMNAHKKLDNSI